MTVNAGKGDRYRPIDVTKYSDNYDKIDWRKTCAYCKGRGMVHVYEQDVDDVLWDDCLHCRGEGKVG